MGSSESKESSTSSSAEVRTGSERRKSTRPQAQGARLSSYRGAPPLPSLSGTPASSTTHVHATSVSRSRPRSITTSVTSSVDYLPRRQPLSLHDEAIAPYKPGSAANMGQGDSKQIRPPSRANTVHIESQSPAREFAATSEPEESPPPNVQPVDVPTVNYDELADQHAQIPGYSESPYNLPSANYSRPPRLPLPISEEVHAPGSPILGTQDGHDDTLLEQADVESGALPRQTSVLSSTTVDDDDIEDEEAYAPDLEWGGPIVPTKLEWNGEGNKVFVTGTFCKWANKVPLHKNKDKAGFSAVIPLPPGTIHIKFLIDGEMLTSNDLPTTVDWTNVLVNYIEVMAPMPTAAEEQKQVPAPAVPMPIPGSAMTAGQATGDHELVGAPATGGADTRAPETGADLSSTLEQVKLHAGSVDQASTRPSVPSAATPSQRPSQIQPGPKHKAAPKKPKVPRPKYTNQIPDFLMALDNFTDPNDEQFLRAQRVAGTLPAPPSLPMFLNKSILNIATPRNDDASVLTMPNHTVLNHLATSSIKSGVLATSGTTRYKRKFLTTIMYKPTSEDG